MTKIVITSKVAKANLKAAVAKDTHAKTLQEQTPLKTRDDLKGFWRQHPKSRYLFGQIVIVWRASSARRAGVPGCWAAYTYSEWSEKTKLPSSTLRWHLDKLEAHGLIERQLGRHGGTRVIAFIRPTALALDLSDARPGDKHHLGLKVGGEVEKPAPATPKMPVPKVKPKPEPKPGDDDYKPQTFEEMMALWSDDEDA